MTRTRTYSWEDPQVFVDAADGLTGLEFLNKIGAGELPLVPAGATTNILPSRRRPTSTSTRWVAARASAYRRRVSTMVNSTSEG